jgi:hypothetical protein
MSRTLTILGSFLISLGSLILLPGCGVEREPRGELHVAGGQPIAADSPAKRSLVALAKRVNNRYDSFCSGTLIAPRLVLTAAHCLAGQTNVDKIRVLFGEDENDPEIPVRAVDAFQTYQNDPSRFYPSFDIAWVRLKENAPSGFEPAEILLNPRKLESIVNVPDALTLAGFGKVSSSCSALEPDCAGKALETQTLLRRFVDTAHFRDLMLIGPKPGFGSCNGDSGGPVYARVEGQWYVLGALHGKSYVLNSKAVLDSERICESGESVYTFAGSYADWLERTSGIRLSRNNLRNPPPLRAPNPPPLPRQPTLVDYLKFDAPLDDLWYTVQVLLSGFQDPEKRIEPDFDLVVTDPVRAAEAMLQWESFSAQGVVYTLTTLAGRDQQIADLRPFTLLDGLKKLELVGHRIRDTAPLGRLSQLEELTLSNNYDFRTKVKIPWDLAFLKNLPRLKVLNLLTNAESLDLKAVPWESLQALETLILSNNAGSLDLYAVPWPKLPRLKHLVIMSSELTDISPLSGATGLEQLNLRRNLIRDISALERLERLRIVDLSQNKIEDFKVVEKLEHLERLLAVDNPTEEAVCPPGASCVYTPEALPTNDGNCPYGWRPEISGFGQRLLSPAIPLLPHPFGRDADATNCIRSLVGQ